MQIYARHAHAVVVCGNMHCALVLLGLVRCRRAAGGAFWFRQVRSGSDGTKVKSYEMWTRQHRRSRVGAKLVSLCGPEQLIREEHSVSGHMCTREAVSQRATGKHGGGVWVTGPRWNRLGGVLWSRRPEPLAPSPPAQRGEAGRGLHRPPPSATCPPSKTRPNPSPVCVYDSS